MRAAVAVLALVVSAAVAGCAEAPDTGAVPGATAPRAARPVAEVGGRSSPFAIVADTPSGAASATLPSGGSRDLVFRVANASDSPRTFTLHSTVPWLAMADSVRVPPRQSTVVTATVQIAQGAPDGVVRGLVVAAASARPDARVPVVYESRAAVSVRVVAP